MVTQAGILANKILKENLKSFEYYEVDHTSGLWRHQTLPIFFTLVVDNFGIQYIDNNHAQHLIDTLKTRYELSINWSSSLYCGITLEWNYAQIYANTSILKYVPTQLTTFDSKKPSKPQYTPLQPKPRIYKKNVQLTDPEDNLLSATNTDKKQIEKVGGSFQYYGRVVDSTTLHTLSTIAELRANQQKG